MVTARHSGPDKGGCGGLRSLVVDADLTDAETMKAPPLFLPVILSRDAVQQLDAEPFGDLPGVSHRVLWRFDSSMAGVLTIEAGHHLGRHAHRAHHHHIWMLEGRASVLEVELGPGA